MSNALYELYNEIAIEKNKDLTDTNIEPALDLNIDDIFTKCVEKCSDISVATKEGSSKETIDDISDLLYLITVLLVKQDIPLEKIEKEIFSKVRCRQHLKGKGSSYTYNIGDIHLYNQRFRLLDR